MNFIVYILISEKIRRYYTGYTHDLEKRLKYHNAGKNRSTKSDRPWKVIYTEKYKEKRSAILRERQIKSFKSGNSLKNLLKQAGIV